MEHPPGSPRMFPRVLAVIVILRLHSLSGQKEPSRLHYTAPYGWTVGPSIVPPGGNAAVTFAPSMPFAGTAEAWTAEVS